jgi:glycosyltransferase involved in cell wall biosynthesis
MADPVHLGLMVFSLAVEASGGGITRFVLDLARNLNPDLIKLTVLALGDFGAPAEQELVQMLRDQHISPIVGAKWNTERPYACFLAAMRTFQSELERMDLDILHSHSEFTDIAALGLKIRAKTPRIIRTLHNGHPLEWRKRPHRRWLFTNFLFPVYYDAEIGVSQPIVNRLNRRWVARCLGRQAKCIPNAIDLNRFQGGKIDISEKKRALGIPIDAAVVGTIGRLEFEKGYTYLLDAARLIKGQRSTVFFVIIGEGSLRQALEEQADISGISDRVIFTGSRSDINQLLPCMDVFACSSLWEGLPTVILESMAAGVPVISSDIPGTRALISHNRNGCLVPAKDPAALADGILFLLSNPDLRTALAKEGLATVQNYSIDRVARSHEVLYRSLPE